MPQVTIQQISPLVNHGLISGVAKLSWPQILISIRGREMALSMSGHPAPTTTAAAPVRHIMPNRKIFANFVGSGNVRQSKIE
jgi:hypothetical protein